MGVFIIRPVTLSIRLAANMTGDHKVMGIAYKTFEFVLPSFTFFLGTFVSLIQSFVFTLLTIVYIALSVEHHDDDHASRWKVGTRTPRRPGTSRSSCPGCRSRCPGSASSPVRGIFSEQTCSGGQKGPAGTGDWRAGRPPGRCRQPLSLGGSPFSREVP